MRTILMVLAACLAFAATAEESADRLFPESGVSDGLAVLVGSDDPALLTVVGSDRMRLVVLRDDAPLFTIHDCQWGPGWTHPKREELGMPKAEGKTRVLEQETRFYKAFWDKTPLPGVFGLRYTVMQKDPRTIVASYALTPRNEDTCFGGPKGQDEAVVAIGPRIPSQPYFNGGTCAIEMEGGKTETLPFPPPRWGGTGVRSATLRTADGAETRLSFDPPTFVHCDVGELRFMVGGAEPVKKGETRTATVTMTLPVEAVFEPANRTIDTSDWLVYEHKNDFSPGSVIGMEDWLHRPAGKHGWMKIAGEGLVFEDGTPVKLYGVGIAWNRFLTTPEAAAQWGDKFVQHGINVVRLIPMMGHGHQGVMSKADHLEFVPEMLAKFDGFHAAMKERGVYLGWSPQYHLFLTPADKERLVDYDELMKGAPDGDVTYSVFDLAPDLQDLMIKQTVALLDHKNPHTSLRYADDPAIAWVEMRNENDIFFNFDNFGAVERKFPGYFRRFQERFGDYLKEKYKDQAAIEKAWGAAYPAGKTLAARDIRPHYPSWELENSGCSPRAADTMHFMYLEQKRFYERYAKAVRDAGYQGALDSSCWQASCFLGHLWNVLSDSEVGIVDRHNYNSTPLTEPGVGNMSAAFQQVKGRPFNLSEWGGGTVAIPTVAAYGLGLQGWDISNQFASGDPNIFNKRARDCNVDCDDFIEIAQFPALARMVYRGDVKEGAVVATRRISIAGLQAGDVGVKETFTLLGGANNKSFSSVVPNAAIAAGRVLLEFIDGPVPENPVVENVSDFIDKESKVVRASNGQLVWHYGGRGYYTIDTPGTQGVVGFVKDKAIDLADVSIATSQNTEMKLYVSAIERNDTIRTAKRLLVTALGRDANTGMVIDEFHDQGEALKEGGEPLLLEPIRAAITLKGRKIKSVLPLDHAGRLRGGAESLKAENDRRGAVFTIDGKLSRTMYYLVEAE